ncbi:MAG TPA: CpsB/CapC family capsule biosynthesis tyrosine phosphatase [Terriglobales bacterium]|nr:CpsB/CapC family capsule biosynthesis tyrosine phosphatase [Terriglobales bacterium]
MVDIHCHILPGIDDGSKSWEMTAQMCRIAAEDGITHIVATPHSNDAYEYNRERYTEMLGQLSDVADGRLTFSLGCDFHFSRDNIEDALEHPQRYTIGDSQYLLVEFSDESVPPSVKRDLFAFSSRGLVPIITHPERNPVLLKSAEMVMDFVEQGCLVQVTANAVTGTWGGRSQKMLEWLLHREAVHVIASDAHDPVYRQPVLSAARDIVSQLAGSSVADALVNRNPAAIIEGRPVPYQPMLR